MPDNILSFSQFMSFTVCVEDDGIDTVFGLAGFCELFLAVYFIGRMSYLCSALMIHSCQSESTNQPTQALWHFTPNSLVSSFCVPLSWVVVHICFLGFGWDSHCFSILN